MIPNSYTLKATFFATMGVASDLGKTNYQINSKRTLYVNETNVTRQEFYESSVANIKISRVIKLNYKLYRKEKYILIDETIYKVIKTYNLGTDIELSLKETTLKENKGWLV